MIRKASQSPASAFNIRKTSAPTGNQLTTNSPSLSLYNSSSINSPYFSGGVGVPHSKAAIMNDFFYSSAIQSLKSNQENRLSTTAGPFSARQMQLESIRSNTPILSSRCSKKAGLKSHHSTNNSISNKKKKSKKINRPFTANRYIAIVEATERAFQRYGQDGVIEVLSRSKKNSQKSKMTVSKFQASKAERLISKRMIEIYNQENIAERQVQMDQMSKELIYLSALTEKLNKKLKQETQLRIECENNLSEARDTLVLQFQRKQQADLSADSIYSKVRNILNEYQVSTRDQAERIQQKSETIRSSTEKSPLRNLHQCEDVSLLRVELSHTRAKMRQVISQNNELVALLQNLRDKYNEKKQELAVKVKQIENLQEQNIEMRIKSNVLENCQNITFQQEQLSQVDQNNNSQILQREDDVNQSRCASHGTAHFSPTPPLSLTPAQKIRVLKIGSGEKSSSARIKNAESIIQYQVNTLKEQLESLKTSLLNQVNQHKDAKQQANKLVYQNQQYCLQLRNAQRQNSEKGMMLSEKKKQCKILRQQLSQLEQALDEKLSEKDIEITRLLGQLHINTTDQEKTLTSMRELEKGNKNLLNQKQILQAKLERVNTKCQELQHQVDNSELQLKQLRATMSVLKGAKESAEQMQRQQLEQLSLSIRSEKNANRNVYSKLAALRSQFSSCSKAVKEIIHGFSAEIIDIKEKILQYVEQNGVNSVQQAQILAQELTRQAKDKISEEWIERMDDFSQELKQQHSQQLDSRKKQIYEFEKLVRELKKENEKLLKNQFSSSASSFNYGTNDVVMKLQKQHLEKFQAFKNQILVYKREKQDQLIELQKKLIELQRQNQIQSNDLKQNNQDLIIAINERDNLIKQLEHQCGEKDKLIQKQQLEIAFLQGSVCQTQQQQQHQQQRRITPKTRISASSYTPIRDLNNEQDISSQLIYTSEQQMKQSHRNTSKPRKQQKSLKQSLAVKDAVIKKLQREIEGKVDNVQDLVQTNRVLNSKVGRLQQQMELTKSLSPRESQHQAQLQALRDRKKQLEVRMSINNQKKQGRKSNQYNRNSLKEKANILQHEPQNNIKRILSSIQHSQSPKERFIQQIKIPSSRIGSGQLSPIPYSSVESSDIRGILMSEPGVGGGNDRVVMRGGDGDFIVGRVTDYDNSMVKFQRSGQPTRSPTNSSYNNLISGGGILGGGKENFKDRKQSVRGISGQRFNTEQLADLGKHIKRFEQLRSSLPFDVDKTLVQEVLKVNVPNSQPFLSNNNSANNRKLTVSQLIQKQNCKKQ